MNTRANILFFIEHLCDLANRSGHVEFVTMIRRDCERIIDAVAPNDGTGAANVKVARQVSLLRSLELVVSCWMASNRIV